MTTGRISDLPLIEFENVTVVRGEKKLLDSVSVTIREDENVAILGPNGAGKSSFIRAITREYYPLAGDDVSFRIRGRERCDVFEMRSLFGIVSPALQYTFCRDLSGRDVVLSGYFSSIGLYNRDITPEMEKRTDRILAFLEIEDLQERKMDSLSSGEARRFLIGRALVHDPKTLILDEPTTSLDLHALHTFRAILRKVARSGTGIIMVTHNLHDIIPEISRVILMKEARFWKDGPKREVLTDDFISGLFQAPVLIREENGYYYATGY
ncbi:MAG TPA: ATP-binding cassette domain-containing protein [Methanoregulaceae archaeon]|jgi:iron complex transport system ATP-binding protein|nr:ATP-binding cassette domain-containing protein [Methanoregulaceae archaeon]